MWIYILLLVAVIGWFGYAKACKMKERHVPYSYPMKHMTDRYPQYYGNQPGTRQRIMTPSFSRRPSMSERPIYGIPY